MKKIKIIYWISTIIFAALMLLSAYPDIVKNEQAIEIMHNQMGYPEYLIQFIGVAKLLGVIAILIPGFNRIKEWAYAGLFFDLIGATYSAIAAAGFDPMMLTMLMFFVPGVVSYIYHHKMLKATGGTI